MRWRTISSHRGRRQGAVRPRIGLRVRPVVILLRRPHNALDGQKIAVIRARCLRELLPVGIVEEQQLGAFGGREDLDAAVPVEVALLQIGFDILFALLLIEIGREIHDQPHPVDGIRRVRISGENIRQRLRADLALRRIHHIGLEIVHASLTGRDDLDIAFPADRVVELLDEPVERLQLVAVIVRPDGQLDRRRKGCRSLRTAGRDAEQQRAREQRRRKSGFSVHVLPSSLRNYNTQSGEKTKFSPESILPYCIIFCGR